MFILISTPLNAASLRTGDVILQPLNCNACWLIEKEEGGPYSHMGMVISNSGRQYVVESIVGVNILPLEKFIKRPTLKRKHLVIRNHEINKLYEDEVGFKKWENELFLRFMMKFYKTPYDNEFDWDNDKLYCSEMVTKLLNPYLEEKIGTKKMHFNQNREHWEKYFEGNIPDGKPGNSPMDFYRSELFEVIGELDEPTI